MNEALPPPIQAVAEMAFTFTKNALRKGATPESASGLIRKVALQADREAERLQAQSPRRLACRAGCSFCCHHTVRATLPEIGAVYDFISRTFTDDQKSRLHGELERYERERTDRSQGSSIYRATACPLLDNGLCSVYEARPLRCRMACSFDAEACRATAESPENPVPIPTLENQLVLYKASLSALRQGLATAAIDNADHELGRCLAELMADPTLIERALAGEVRLPGIESSAPLAFPVDPEEAHGQPDEDPVVDQAKALYREGDSFGAEAILTKSSITHLLARLALPRMCESEEEILESRAEYERRLDELLDSEFDAREAFNSLPAHGTFNLAYQGLSVRHLLEKHGRLMVEKIAQRALPHLSIPIDSERKPGRFRLGYLSPNMRNSNGSKWALGWLENHSKEFEIHSFNTGDIEDLISHRFRGVSDHYYRFTGSVQKAAEFIRSLDLDALIITDIGMHDRDYQYASLRLARVQCTAWGHPVTSGLPTIDYYLSSDFMEPSDAQDEYSEELVRLPRSALCYRRRSVPTGIKTKAELGLGDGPLIFMGQSLQKWTPKRDELLKRIWDRSGVTPVFLSATLPFVDRVFRTRLERLKVPSLILPRMTEFDYNRLVQIADVAFDPPDWSGGNSTIEAMTAGTPVVTLPGEFMRGRHSYAFHRIAGTEGLIAKDEDEFVELVCDTARCREAMAGIDVDSLYGDRGVVEALDEFLLSTMSR